MIQEVLFECVVGGIFSTTTKKGRVSHIIPITTPLAHASLHVNLLCVCLVWSGVPVRKRPPPLLGITTEKEFFLVERRDGPIGLTTRTAA